MEWCCTIWYLEVWDLYKPFPLLMRLLDTVSTKDLFSLLECRSMLQLSILCAIRSQVGLSELQLQSHDCPKDWPEGPHYAVTSSAPQVVEAHGILDRATSSDHMVPIARPKVGTYTSSDRASLGGLSFFGIWVNDLKCAEIYQEIPIVSTLSSTHKLRCL